jgi:hypothetical protein
MELKLINPSNPVFALCTKGFEIYKESHILPTHCIYVFCVDLRTNSDYFPVQHWLAGFHNRDGECLLRCTDWVFKYNVMSNPHYHTLFLGFIF